MTHDLSHPLVIGVTGASGAVYAARLVQTAVDLGRETHLAISPSGRTVWEHELGAHVSAEGFAAEDFLRQARSAVARLRPREQENAPSPSASESSAARLHLHRYDDYLAPIASGSREVANTWTPGHWSTRA